MFERSSTCKIVDFITHKKETVIYKKVRKYNQRNMPYIIPKENYRDDVIDGYVIQNDRPIKIEELVVYHPSRSHQRRRRRRRRGKIKSEYFTQTHNSPYREEVVLLQHVPPESRTRYHAHDQEFYLVDGGYYANNININSRTRGSRMGYQQRHNKIHWNLPRPPMEENYRVDYTTEEDYGVLGVIGQHPVKPQREEEWEIIADYPQRNAASVVTSEDNIYDQTFQHRNYEFTSTSASKQNTGSDNVDTQQKKVSFSSKSISRQERFSDDVDGTSAPTALQSLPTENVVYAQPYKSSQKSTQSFQQGEEVVHSNNNVTLSSKVNSLTNISRDNDSQGGGYTDEPIIEEVSSNQQMSSNDLFTTEYFDWNKYEERNNTTSSNKIINNNSNNNNNNNIKPVKEKRIVPKRNSEKDLKKWKKSQQEKTRTSHPTSSNESDLKEWLNDTRNTKTSKNAVEIPAEKITVNKQNKDEKIEEVINPDEIVPLAEAQGTGHLDTIRNDFWDRFEDKCTEIHNKKKQFDERKEKIKNAVGEKKEKIKNAIHEKKEHIKDTIEDIVEDLKESPWGRYISSLGRKETCAEFQKRIKNQTIFVTPTFADGKRPYNKELNLDKLIDCGCCKPFFISEGFESRSNLPKDHEYHHTVDSDHEEDDLPCNGSYVKLFCKYCERWETDSQHEEEEKSHETKKTASSNNGIT